MPSRNVESGIRFRLYVIVIASVTVCSIFVTLQSFGFQYHYFTTWWATLLHATFTVLCGMYLCHDATICLSAFIPSMFASMDWLKKCW